MMDSDKAYLIANRIFNILGSKSCGNMLTDEAKQKVTELIQALKLQPADAERLYMGMYHSPDWLAKEVIDGEEQFIADLLGVTI